MRDYGELRYFTDAQVESYFNISVSKLRTAQRLHLVEASTGQRNHRHVRLWRADHVLRVWIAEKMSSYTGLPYNVCVGICAAAPLDRWSPFFEVIFSGRDPDVIPLLYIQDRELILAKGYGESFIHLGNITVKDDNRMSFVPGDHGEITPPQRPLCMVCFDGGRAATLFREIYVRAT